MAVLGDVPDARLERRAHAGALDRRARRPRSTPAVGRPQAGDRTRSARPARWRRRPRRRRSPPPAPSKDTPRSAGSPRSSDASQAATRSSSGSPGARVSFSTRSSTSRPTISRARLRSVAPSVETVSTRLPRRRTVTRSATVEHLVELVGDEHDRGAVLRQRPQDAEELLRLLGGEHGGRLVEHQHLRAAEQRAQDLHPLLGADAELSTRASGSTASPKRSESSRVRAAAARVVEQRPAAGAARRPARGSRPRS